MTNPKNILIVRTDKIGDVVLTLPIVNLLKRKYPSCKITFMVREYTKPIVEGNNLVDEILVYDEKKPFDVTLLELKIKRYDTCLVVHPKFRIALLLFLAKIKIRIGTGYRWYSFLFNKKIYEHRKYGKNHELNHNINLLKLLGVNEEVTEDTVAFNLHSNAKSAQNVEKFLNSLNINKEDVLVIIHPGSGGSAVDLPISHFKELVNTLAQELGITILLTGSESEKEICEGLMAEKNTYNLAGKFDLSELIALIDKCELLIANSTGPIHLAAALNKNVIGFYPKIASCSVTRWGPYTNKRIIFSPNIDCDNCTREQCERLNCMSSIDVQEIVNSAKNILIN